jgi:hypothetical protein
VQPPGRPPAKYPPDLALARRPTHARSIPGDIILSLITCGLFNLWVQAKQMAAVNDMLQAQKYSFVAWLLLCVVTCGIYHMYHEYRLMSDICAASKTTNANEPWVCLALSVFGLTIVADAIQQTHINAYYGDTRL